MNKKNKMMIKKLHVKNFKTDNKYNNKKINKIKRYKNKKKVEIREQIIEQLKRLHKNKNLKRLEFNLQIQIIHKIRSRIII